MIYCATDPLKLESLHRTFDVAANGHVFASTGSSIAKIDQDLNVELFAGRIASFNFAEGHKTEVAQFNEIGGILVINRRGQLDNPVLMVTDTASHVIARIKNDVVTRYAGTEQGGVADGPRRLATFSFPEAITHDASGNIYVLGRGSSELRVIGVDGMVTTIRYSQSSLAMAPMGLSSPTSIVTLIIDEGRIQSFDFVTGTSKPMFEKWNGDSQSLEAAMVLPPFPCSAIAYSPASQSALCYQPAVEHMIIVKPSEQTADIWDLRLKHVSHVVCAPSGDFWVSSMSHGLQVHRNQMPAFEPIYKVEHLPHKLDLQDAPTSLPSLRQINLTNGCFNVNIQTWQFLSSGVQETAIASFLEDVPEAVLSLFVATMNGSNEAFEALRLFSSAKPITMTELRDAALLLRPLSSVRFRHFPKENGADSIGHGELKDAMAKPEISLFDSYLSLIRRAIGHLSIKDQVQLFVNLKPNYVSKSFALLDPAICASLSFITLDFIKLMKGDGVVHSIPLKQAIIDSGDSEYVETQITARLTQQQFNTASKSTIYDSQLRRLKTVHLAVTPASLLKRALRDFWMENSPNPPPVQLPSLDSDDDTISSQLLTAQWDEQPLPEPNFELILSHPDPDLPLPTFHSVKVHDTIFCSRWPFFNAMIRSGLLEARTGSLSFPVDFPLEVIVRYIYTGRYDYSMPASAATFITERGLEYSWTDFETGRPTIGFEPLVLSAQAVLQRLAHTSESAANAKKGDNSDS